MIVNLELRGTTPADHRFWYKIELAMDISIPSYLKNILL